MNGPLAEMRNDKGTKVIIQSVRINIVSGSFDKIERLVLSVKNAQSGISPMFNHHTITV